MSDLRGRPTLRFGWVEGPAMELEGELELPAWGWGVLGRMESRIRGTVGSGDG